MANFHYRARTPRGNIVTGIIEGQDQQFVVDKLRGQRYIVLDISESKKGPLSDMMGGFNFLKRRVRAKELVLFSRQLSTLVSAGVPIVQGLTILIEQITNPAFKKIVDSLRTDIEAGISIAEAMARYPQAFSGLYVNMIKAGELGGILDVILERISAYLEAAEQLKNRVKGALIYPAVVSTVAVGVTVFLLVVVIPTFKKIFSQFGTDLPLPTQILIGLSEWLKHYILFIFIGFVIFLIVLRQYYKTEAGQTQIDGLLLKVPIFGVLLRKVAIAKFSRTFGTLVKSGVPILQALDTVAKTAGNKVVEIAVLKSKESIREGERIAEPLKASRVFPPMVIQMIAVGEETGNLDTMLAKIADFYDQEVDVAVDALTSMIEPIIIVIMGIVIGAIVIAMFMPMFQMGELAGRM